MRRIYLASSWRNQNQPAAVLALRAAGHEVYDFRNPAHGVAGFSWSEVSTVPPLLWTSREYLDALAHPAAEAGYACDMAAMQWCDTCVLLLPCGRSAHLEAGWCVGTGREVYVVHPSFEEPELMAKMATGIVASVDELITLLEG